MQIKGVVESWNDERGFGFITPLGGGPEIFFHITAFPGGEGRPHVKQCVLFEVESGPEGKKRARNIEMVHFGHSRANEGSPELRVRRSIRSLLAIPAFIVMYIVFSLWGEAPVWLALVYVVASVITYLTYAYDKSSARRGAWRTSESTLHALAFAGGWPGALLAQEFLRHKSAKVEFRAVFWCTVVMNVAGFLLVCSTIGSEL